MSSKDEIFVRLQTDRTDVAELKIDELKDGHWLICFFLEAPGFYSSAVSKISNLLELQF